MIAWPDEFSKINLATPDEELAQIVRREYGPISDKQYQTVQIKEEEKRYVFLDLNEITLSRLLMKYEGQFFRKTFQFEIDDKPATLDEIPNVSDVLIGFLQDLTFKK